jgi:hypothetical protein
MNELGMLMQDFYLIHIKVNLKQVMSLCVEIYQANISCHFI